MSGAIRLAKAAHRGDPGLFGDIGKFIGGAVKGTVGGLLTGNPLAAIGGGVMGGINAVKGAPKPAINIASNGKPLNPSVVQLAQNLPVLRPTVSVMPPQIPDSTVTRTSGVSLFPGGPMVGTQTQTQHFSPVGKPGQSCGNGYHLNKSGYYTRQGYVAPGSKCVRNRRRNPLNPRAASRAMSRLTSARKATRGILKFFGSTSRRNGSAPRKKSCRCR